MGVKEGVGTLREVGEEFISVSEEGEEGTLSKRRQEGSSVYHTRAGGRLHIEFESCTLLFHHRVRREEEHGGIGETGALW